jgi:hypothetical protein
MLSAYGGSVIFAGFGAYLFYRGLQRLRAPTSDQLEPQMRFITMGLVEMPFMVRSQEVLKTPATGTPCVYYKHELREYKADKKGKYKWVTVKVSEHSTLFTGANSTGEIMIDPAGAEWHVPLKNTLYQTATNGTPALLGRQEQPLTPNPGDKLHLEYYIAPGEQIFVLGTMEDDKQKRLIHKGDIESAFVISLENEQRITSIMRREAFIRFLVGTCSLITAALLLMKIMGSL